MKRLKFEEIHAGTSTLRTSVEFKLSVAGMSVGIDCPYGHGEYGTEAETSILLSPDQLERLRGWIK